MTKRSSHGNGKPSLQNASGRKSRAARAASGHATAGAVKGLGSPVLITGGAGFLGTNLAHHLLAAGRPVLLFDNLSRPGVERNVHWLRATHGELVQVEIGDILDYRRLRKVVRGVSQVFHFAAQVAVTTSLANPFHDFEVNARGTLNLLESLRELPHPPPLLYTSTNKVYGDLNDIVLRANGSRYQPEADHIRGAGFDEHRALDFRSPYGCSKGAAEQYVLDYARTYRLPTVVFRMSCIYGPHQFGTEDQGWVAHFLIQALEGSPITVYGDGKQVRDILFIEDLVEAFERAHQHVDAIAGQAFNIGGGPTRTISLLELIDLIAEFQGEPPEVRFESWRPADQQFYVSDIRKFTAATGWTPKVTVRQGIGRLHQWLAGSSTLPVLPLVPAPEVVAPSFGKTPPTLAKFRPSDAALPGKEPRSKRIWNLSPEARDPHSDKIIKFP